MTSVQIAEIEGAIRNYLRTNSETNAVVGTRVFFGLPENVAFPCYVIKQIGGGLLPTYAPIHEALLQIDCFGEARNKAQAATAMKTLVAVLEDLKYGDALDGDTIVFGASVDSIVFFPEPATDQARYVVTASVSAQLASYA